MRPIRNFTFTLPVLAAFFLVTSLQAQGLERSLLSSAGMQQENAAIALEWSVGEAFVTDFQAGDFLLTQGFHQGGGLIGQVFTRAGWNYQVRLFPNPVSHDLYMQKEGPERFQLKVFDLLGQPVAQDNWSGETKSLNVRNLEAGAYLILLIDERGAYAGFPFIKQ